MYRKGLKRAFDAGVSLLFLTLFLFPLGLGLLFLKMTMGGPVFFRQVRIGRFGRRFSLIKLRTMAPNNWANHITVSNDPRLTAVGCFLRKFKLDEIPQLWNVLKGEMSLVGPRPDVPGYSDLLTGDDRRILLLRPGITGPASLKYADEENLLARAADPVAYNDTVIYPDKVRINLRYAEEYGFGRDLRYLLKTAICALWPVRCGGAERPGT